MNDDNCSPANEKHFRDEKKSGCYELNKQKKQLVQGWLTLSISADMSKQTINYKVKYTLTCLINLKPALLSSPLLVHQHNPTLKNEENKTNITS